MTTTTTPASAKEAATALQDSHDERDRLQRRFDAGDPPTQREWTTSLQNVEYAILALKGLTAKEESESEAVARKRARELRRKYRVDVGKQLGTVVSAQDGVAKAIETLVQAVSFANDKASSIGGSVRALLPDHLPVDPAPDFLKDALRFGGSVPPQTAAGHLIACAVHDALERHQKTLLPPDIALMRSMEGPPLQEASRVSNLRQTLEIKE